MATQNENKSIRTLPHNNDAEQNLLGCILVDADIGNDILSQISIDDFYLPSHKIIAQAMKDVLQRNKPLEYVTVVDELETKGEMPNIGGNSYLTTLIAGVPSAANYKFYMEIVKRDGTLRKLIRACSQIIEECYNSNDVNATLSQAEKLIYDIGESNTSNKMSPIRDCVVEVMNKFDLLHRDKDAFRGIPTGFRMLDSITNGLQKGDLVILAARPGVGKSSLAMNIVESAALKGFTSVVFSLEMPRIQIAQRMLCSLASVKMEDALSGNLESKDWNKLWPASDTMQDFKIFVDDSSAIIPAEILSKCRRLKNTHSLDLIVVDYIGLMKSGNTKVESRQQEISEITRSLKIIAKELNVPVLALSQMSRLVEREKREPQLSDLRDSGAIEQDADIVMFINKVEKEGDTVDSDITDVDLIIAKHRNGRQGKVPLTWFGGIVRFKSRDDYSVELTNQYKDNKKSKQQTSAVEEVDMTKGVPPPTEAPIEVEQQLPIIDNDMKDDK